MSADPTTTTPKAIVDAAYDLISFEAGSEPEWERFRELFLPEAVLAFRVFPEDETITVMDLDAYMVKQMREGMKEEGYSETVVKRTEVIYRDIAECRVLFHMQFGTAEPFTAIDIFQLVYRDGRWWVASIVSDILQPGEAIPAGVV